MHVLTRTLPLAGLLALGLGLTPALAQEPDIHIYRAGRARIGVMVEMQADAERDKQGAALADVLPDGPAARAGLARGDVITRFNGTALAGLPEVDGASGPGSRLVELARELNPGDTVKVEYRRNGDARSTSLVAEKADMAVSMRRMENLPFNFRLSPEGPMGPRAFTFDDDDFGGMVFAMRGLGGLELTEMNAGLGEYFGTSEGMLLLEAPRDSTLPLRAGDVLLAIDGRAPKSTAHARRILGSYAGGEAVEFRIMRQKKQQTVRWTVPEREWRMDRSSRSERSPERVRSSSRS